MLQTSFELLPMLVKLAPKPLITHAWAIELGARWPVRTRCRPHRCRAQRTTEIRDLQNHHYNHGVPSVTELPPVETESLEDGCVRVRVGDQMGTVSSFHLVEPKANQLVAAWLKARAAEVIEG